MPHTALLVVDVQNDFCPGGALAVPEGDRVVPVVNAWLARARQSGWAVAFTQDWHPPYHVSFQDRGGPWPPHCVQDTWGAALAAGLEVPPDAPRFVKGYEPDVDAYSGFGGRRAEEAAPVGPRLLEWLVAEGVHRVVVMGLATDYCVAATAKDALAAGFPVVVDPRGCRAVNVHPSDGAAALAQLAEAGATVLQISDDV